MKNIKGSHGLALLIAASLCSGLTCCIAVGAYVRRANSAPMAILHDGIERTFYLHVPPQYDGTKPIPLVIAMHGGGGTAAGMRKLANGLDDLADAESFVVVYPNGIDKHWNDGREMYVRDGNVDDVGFLSALIDHISENYAIDPKRVYAAGISNGGLMSLRLACELPEKIAAVAPVTAALSEDLHATCAPSQPISVLVINGTEDPLVLWDGGEVAVGRQKRGQVLSTPDTIAFWVARNNCAAPPAISRVPDSDPKDGTQVRTEVYEQCDSGTAVALYTIEGGGHTWPGGWQYLPESIIGKTSREVDANEVIWRFFESHAKGED